MRLGVSVRSSYPHAPARASARWMVERAAAARDAGLHSLFVGDHHVTASTYHQNSPVLGRMLAEWGDGPAGALYLLPLWHPVLVAEQVGTLAALASGRFILQCAVGGGEAQFRGVGVPLGERPSRFEQALHAIRRLLAGEEVSLDGRWQLDGARIGPLPEEPVEVWIGAGADAAIDRAARLGDAWLAGPGVTTAQARGQARLYQERCDAHGRRSTAVAIRRDVHVGADDAEARRAAQPVIDAGYRGFDPSVLVVGGPDRVAEELAALAELGYTDVLIRHLVDDQTQVLASFEQLAAVREALAAV